MSLMTSIYTGVSGLRTSQNALNTTSHNLANINTDGYVRQQVSFADTRYMQYGFSVVNTMQVGLGVVSAETRHLRDLLLDNSFRLESGRQQFYASQYEAVEEVESIFGETEGTRFQNSLNDLWEAMSEVAKTPDSNTARAGLVMNANTFLARAEAMYDELYSYQLNVDTMIQETVAKVNKLGDTIYELNMRIQSVEAPGVETASDLRDARDRALDELSELVDIDVEENATGLVKVRAEGQEFIVEDGCFHMGMAQLDTELDSAFYSPTWPQLGGAAVFNLHIDINTGNNNDIGRLKGLLLARGSYAANYTDIPIRPDPADYNLNDPNELATYREALENYNEEAHHYNYYVDNTVIMKTQALFDQLVNGIVTTVNDLLCPNITTSLESSVTFTIPAGTVIETLDGALKNQLRTAVDNGTAAVDKFGALTTDTTITLAAGTEITCLDSENASYGQDENKTQGTELFSRKDVKRYTVLEGSDGKTYHVYNPYTEFGTESLYSCRNLEVNKVIQDNYAYLPFTTKEEEIDLKLGEEILAAWDKPFKNLDPNNITKKDFTDYYSAMIGEIANDGYMHKSISENQSTVVLDIDSSRESAMGVTSEEELSNMIKFQNAYNASSRYVTTIADMIDTIIQKVGHW